MLSWRCPSAVGWCGVGVGVRGRSLGAKFGSDLHDGGGGVVDGHAVCISQLDLYGFVMGFSVMCQYC